MHCSARIWRFDPSPIWPIVQHEFGVLTRLTRLVLPHVRGVLTRLTHLAPHCSARIWRFDPNRPL